MFAIVIANLIYSVKNTIKIKVKDIDPDIDPHPDIVPHPDIDPHPDNDIDSILTLILIFTLI